MLSAYNRTVHIAMYVIGGKEMACAVTGHSCLNYAQRYKFNDLDNLFINLVRMF